LNYRFLLNPVWGNNNIVLFTTPILGAVIQIIPSSRDLDFRFETTNVV